MGLYRPRVIIIKMEQLFRTHNASNLGNSLTRSYIFSNKTSSDANSSNAKLSDSANLKGSGVWTNKSSSFFNDLIKKPVVSQEDERTMDYLKKVVFDNRDLVRRNKELQERNDFLENEIQSVEDKHNAVKENLLIMKDKYNKLILIVPEEMLDQQIDLVSPVEPTLFELMCASNLRTKTLSKKETNCSDSADSCLKTLTKNLEFDPRSRPPLQCLKNMSNSPIKEEQRSEAARSPSKRAPKNSTTQTQVWVPSVTHMVSIREGELVREVEVHKSCLSEMESKYTEVLEKYQKIKSIIGGVY